MSQRTGPSHIQSNTKKIYRNSWMPPSQSPNQEEKNPPPQQEGMLGKKLVTTSQGATTPHSHGSSDQPPFKLKAPRTSFRFGHVGLSPLNTYEREDKPNPLTKTKKVKSGGISIRSVNPTTPEHNAPPSSSREGDTVRRVKSGGIVSQKPASNVFLDEGEMLEILGLTNTGEKLKPQEPESTKKYITPQKNTRESDVIQRIKSDDRSSRFSFSQFSKKKKTPERNLLLSEEQKKIFERAEKVEAELTEYIKNITQKAEQKSEEQEENITIKKRTPPGDEKQRKDGSKSSSRGETPPRSKRHSLTRQPRGEIPTTHRSSRPESQEFSPIKMTQPAIENANDEFKTKKINQENTSSKSPSSEKNSSSESYNPNEEIDKVLHMLDNLFPKKPLNLMREPTEPDIHFLSTIPSESVLASLDDENKDDENKDDVLPPLSFRSETTVSPSNPSSAPSSAPSSDPSRNSLGENSD